jgi:spermidine/putrescine transport system substrate-binding protein
MTDPDRVSVAFLWDTQSPRWNRRTFMKTMAFATAAGFVAAACGSDDDNGGTSSGSGTTTPGSTKAEPKTLNFYNWTDYVAEDTVPNFEKQTGIKVTYDNYTSNDELVTKLQGGGSGYDLIVPTDSTLTQLRNEGLLEPINHALIPNITNLDERFQNPDYDPNNEYSIPWQWGTTGIGYDPDKVGQQVTDWDAFKLASVKNKAMFLDEARDAFGMALFALGHDPNTTDDGQLDEARDYLIEVKGNMKAISSDYKEPLQSGEVILAHAYSGDVFQAIDEGADTLEYVIPKSGAFQWVDAMAIPKGASHPGNAHAFMNYILDAKVGAELTNYVSYGSPNKASEPLIDKEITSNPLIYPPADILSKLAFLKDLGEDELKYSDRWTEVKTA